MPTSYLTALVSLGDNIHVSVKSSKASVLFQASHWCLARLVISTASSSPSIEEKHFLIQTLMIMNRLKECLERGGGG